MPARLYVGGLSYDVRERDLQDLFKKYGDIREVTIKSGFGFVEYEDDRDADDAVRGLDRMDFFGRRLAVEFARNDRFRGRRDRDRSRSRSPDRHRRRHSRSRSRSRGRRYDRPHSTEFRLIIENLPRGSNWQDIKDFFRRAGEVTYADVRRERPDEGIVDFATYDDMKAALEKLDGEDWNGNRIRLVEDKSRVSESRRSRTRSRSRSRSPPKRERSRTPERTRDDSRSRSRSRD